jgi:hypothetical protein
MFRSPSPRGPSPSAQAASVVGDLHAQQAVKARHPDVDLRGGGVLEDIVKRLFTAKKKWCRTAVRSAACMTAGSAQWQSTDVPEKNSSAYLQM